MVFRVMLLPPPRHAELVSASQVLNTRRRSYRGEKREPLHPLFLSCEERSWKRNSRRMYFPLPVRMLEHPFIFSLRIFSSSLLRQVGSPVVSVCVTPRKLEKERPLWKRKYSLAEITPYRYSELISGSWGFPLKARSGKER